VKFWCHFRRYWRRKPRKKPAERYPVIFLFLDIYHKTESINQVLRSQNDPPGIVYPWMMGCSGRLNTHMLWSEATAPQPDRDSANNRKRKAATPERLKVQKLHFFKI